MAIQCQCPACSQRFQVPESALGKRVKCPKCAVGDPAQSAQGGTARAWELSPPNGLCARPTRSSMAPCPRPSSTNWSPKGVCDAFCHVRQADWDEWKPIEEVYPQFAVGSDAPAESPDLAALVGSRAATAPLPRLRQDRLAAGDRVSQLRLPDRSAGRRAATLPRRTSSAPKPSGKKRNRKIAFLASAGVVLSVLARRGCLRRRAVWRSIPARPAMR